jgi:hypothetical protein
MVIGTRDTHQEASWAGHIVPAASYAEFDHVREGPLVVPRRSCQGYMRDQLGEAQRSSWPVAPSWGHVPGAGAERTQRTDLEFCYSNFIILFSYF